MARTFSTGTDCLHITSAVDIPFINGYRTISLWTYRSDDGDSNLGRSFQISSSSGFVIAVFNANGSRVKSQISYTSIPERFSNYPSLNVWHHWIWQWAMPATYDATAFVQVWVDGTQAHNGGSGGSGSPNANDWTSIHVGNTGGHTRSYDGRIAEFALWDRQLTTQQITTLANGRNPLDYKGDLVMYCPILGDDSPEPDLSGNGHDLVINGSIAQSGHPSVDPPTEIWGLPMGVS